MRALVAVEMVIEAWSFDIGLEPGKKIVSVLIFGGRFCAECDFARVGGGETAKNAVLPGFFNVLSKRPWRIGADLPCAGDGQRGGAGRLIALGGCVRRGLGGFARGTLGRGGEQAEGTDFACGVTVGAAFAAAHGYEPLPRCGCLKA